jgi:hypothetical protein
MNDTQDIAEVGSSALVRLVGLLALLLIVGPPYLVVLLFAGPAGVCCDDPNDPFHRLLDPLLWWVDSWKACRFTPNAQDQTREPKTSI